jgi:hypothetical protein
MAYVLLAMVLVLAFIGLVTVFSWGFRKLWEVS